jgi:phage-related protein
MGGAGRKRLVWVGSCKEDLLGFPRDVRRVLGFALGVAQRGGKHPDAKPLKGFGGAGVLEVVKDHDRRTFRAVYTVRLGERVYALHAFQKKSTQGSSTPKREIDLVRQRLREAEELHRIWLEEGGNDE